MNDTTHESTINVNAWNLQDLHQNMLSQIECLSHLIAVTDLASGANDVKQLKGVIHMLTENLHQIKGITQNDHESMEHLINEASIA